MLTDTAANVYEQIRAEQDLQEDLAAMRQQEALENMKKEYDDDDDDDDDDENDDEEEVSLVYPVIISVLISQ